MTIKVGCQTFTWEMLGPQWTGDADDLVDAIAAAGYGGIEITDTMIGDYAERPADFAARLKDAGLTLVAFACGAPSGFTEPAARADDLALVEYWLPFVAAFPGALLSLGSATIVSEGDRAAKFDAAGSFYNAAGELGLKFGGFASLEAIVKLQPDFIVISNDSEFAEDEGRAFLLHPALEHFYPPSKRLVVPERLTVCGGPMVADALDRIVSEITRAEHNAGTTTATH